MPKQLSSIQLDLESEVFLNCQKMTFVAVYAYLRELLAYLELPIEQHLLVTSSLDIQTSEVQVVSVKKVQDSYLIEANILGIYGSKSPLPSYFNDELKFLQKNDKHLLRIQLDCIQQPLYRKLAEVKLNKLQHVFDTDNSLIKILRGMLPLAYDSQLIPVLFKNINYIRNMRGSRSAITSVLLDIFVGSSIQIDGFCSRTLQVPKAQQAMLGIHSTKLGSSALLGNELLDSKNKINITLKNISADQHRVFVTNSARFEELKHIVRYLVAQPVSIELTLIMNDLKGYPAQLSGSNLTIGKDSWLTNNQPSVDTKYQLSVIC